MLGKDWTIAFWYLWSVIYLWSWIYLLLNSYLPLKTEIIIGAETKTSYIHMLFVWLGLATHELHFTIIREEFKPNQKRPCEICGQIGKLMVINYWYSVAVIVYFHYDVIWILKNDWNMH